MRVPASSMGQMPTIECGFQLPSQKLSGVLLKDLPTHRTICQQQIHILRIQDNQIAEHWVVRDDLAMMVQLGMILAPGYAST